MRQDLKDKYSERLGVSTRNEASRANEVNGKDNNPYPACLGIVVAHLFAGLLTYLLWRFNR
jgi:hypothetical protein